MRRVRGEVEGLGDGVEKQALMYLQRRKTRWGAERTKIQNIIWRKNVLHFNERKHLLLKPFYALVSLDAVACGIFWCGILEHSSILQLDHDGLREQ